jgi:hypothetical protein
VEVLVVVQFERALAADQEGLARVDVKPLSAELE